MEDERENRGLVARELAELPARTTIDCVALARILDVERRTIQNMVKRGDLPRPFLLANRQTWFAGEVLDHLGKVAQQQLAQVVPDA